MSMFIYVTVDWFWVNGINLKLKIDYLSNITFISFILGKKKEFKFTSGWNSFLGFQNLILKSDIFLYWGFAAVVNSTWKVVSPSPSPPEKGSPTQPHLKKLIPPSELSHDFSHYWFICVRVIAWLLHQKKALCEIKECLFASGFPVPPTVLGTESLLYKYLLSAWIHFLNGEELVKTLF